jgi:hypothetical protein
MFDFAKRFILWNAGVSDSVQPTFKQGCIICCRQAAPIINALVGIVRYQIKHIFLKIGTGARDACNVACFDHWSKASAEFCCAHGTGEGDKKSASVRKELRQRGGGCCKSTGVEVTIVFIDKRSNGHNQASL